MNQNIEEEDENGINKITVQINEDISKPLPGPPPKSRIKVNLVKFVRPDLGPPPLPKKPDMLRIMKENNKIQNRRSVMEQKQQDNQQRQHPSKVRIRHSKVSSRKLELLSKSEWVTKVLQSNPEIQNIKERINPLYRAISFAEHYRGRSYVPHDLILQLVMQYLEHEGLRSTLRVLERESNIPYESKDIEDCRLVTLIMSASRDVEQLFDYSISQYDDIGESSTNNEILNDLLSSMNLLRVETNDDKNASSLLVSNNNNEDEIIYEEDQPNVISAASLNKLVEHLTPSGVADLLFIQTFMSTYTSFTTPEVLLAKLKQRYNNPFKDQGNNIESSNDNHKNILPIQIRVINVIKQWIDEYGDDFDENLVEQIRDFLLFEVRKDHPKHSKQLIDLLEKNFSSHYYYESYLSSSKDNNNYDDTKDQPKPIVPRNIFSPNLTWEDIDEEELARQLTLIEYKYFVRIKTSELLNQAWSKPKLRHRAPNIIQMINRFNELSQWVGSVIVTTQRLKHRIKVLTKLIRVAEFLRKYNNFNSLMAFIAVFNSAAIHRLKHTFSELPPSSIETLNELSNLMDSENGYKVYKSVLESTSPPCIPYLGIFLTDLVYSEEVNETMVGNLINFRKCRSLYQIISKIKYYQQIRYNLQEVVQIQSFFFNFQPRVDDKDMFKFSCVIEPRGVDKSSLT